MEEPMSNRKQVLSEIEQSVQNALALFKSEDFGILPEPIPVFEDPIVSLVDSKINKTSGKEEKSIELQEEERNPTFLEKIIPKFNFGDFFPTSYTQSAANSNIMSLEPINLPFSDDPIKSSVEQMQKLLNDREIGSHEEIYDPSPEDILNVYSKDLGIHPSPNISPRNDRNNQYNDNELNKLDKIKKDKKQLKPIKQNKSFNEKKTELKQKDTSKSAVFSVQENRMKDILNIYGSSSSKVLHPKSDSTVGSKTHTNNKKLRSKKTKKFDETSKASSTTHSRKSKRKQKRNVEEEQSENFLREEYSNIEKSSKISTKRKLKQIKNSNNFKIKNQSSKRKRVNVNNDHLWLNPSKNPPKNQKGLVESDKHCAWNRQKKTQKASSINNFKYPEVKSKNSSAFNDINQLPHLTTSEKVLGRRLSKEDNYYNKHVLFNDKIEKEEHLKINLNQVEESQNVTNYDDFNDDFNDQQTLHYALPTHSSRSKEVERFLNGHYQHLPFVIGQSTNKSHNLWVNIQEALSLIKQKVPQTSDVQSVVPNSVEIEKTPSIFSKISSSSKSIKKPHKCPAMVTGSLYDIPEGVNETEEKNDVINSWEDHPECMKANIDPSYSRSRCTCLTQPTTSYKKVMRQIFGGASEGSVTSSENCQRKDEFVQDQGGDSYLAQLRKALISFTQEFEDMNNKFEEMSADPNASKEELERLEVQLANKEEEIKELIARFNEVKELNERAHENGRMRPGYFNLESYKSTTSIRLAQTLRRVQKFKDSLKSRPSVPYLNKNIYMQSSY